MKPTMRWKLPTLVVITAALPAAARADFPGGTIHADREGRFVRLEITYAYHGFMPSYCDGVLTRNEGTSENGPVIFDGDLGRASYKCECAKWFTWQVGMEDAEGQVCEPGDGINDVQGSCPEGHTCMCTQHCEPYLDEPCYGSYTYRFSPRGYSHPYGNGEVHGTIEVNWIGVCSGQGCSTAGPRPHLAMILIFALGAVLPLIIRARSRSRRR